MPQLKNKYCIEKMNQREKKIGEGNERQSWVNVEMQMRTVEESKSIDDAKQLGWGVMSVRLRQQSVGRQYEQSILLLP